MLMGSGEIVEDEALIRELAVRTLTRIHGEYTDELRPRVEMVIHNRVAIRIKPHKVTSWDHRKLGLIVGSTLAGN
jgi:hypothetical protein